MPTTRCATSWAIIQAAPDIAKKVVQMRHMGAQMLEHFAGRAIHPTFSQAGRGQQTHDRERAQGDAAPGQ